jgi:hypothetical protein
VSREAFDLELGRLAVLPGMPGESDAYWETLKDIPDDVFVSAIGHALKTRKWFPVPVELRQDADAVKPRVMYQPFSPKARQAETVSVFIPNPFEPGKGITLSVAKDSGYECNVCSDTGWDSVWCGPKTKQTLADQEFIHCGRRHEHGSHEWVRKCQCWDTNRVLIERREAQAQYAAQREQKR